MVAREYDDPPVHEVLLDVRFAEEVGREELAGVPDVFGDEFDSYNQAQETKLTVGAGPGGGESFRSDRRFGGWIFQSQDPVWVLRTTPSRLVLHSARSGNWPKGPYVGWDRIYEKFADCYKRIVQVYPDLVERLGLRYLNRIAVPLGSALEDYLNIGLRAPDLLRRPATLNLSQIWAEVDDYDEVRAKIGLARIEIEDEQLAEQNLGLQLDIDVFNQWPEGDYLLSDKVLEWYPRAHSAENDIFEDCITDRLRELFSEEEPNA